MLGKIGAVLTLVVGAVAALILWGPVQVSDDLDFFKGGPRLSETTLERGIATMLTKQGGQTPDRIDCPHDGLAAEVGATQRCTLIAGRAKYGITVKVDRVMNGTAHYSIVNKQPAGR